MRWGRSVCIFVFAILAPAAAWACSAPPDDPIPTDRDHYAAAQLVVLAHMTKVEERVPPDLENGSAGILVGTLHPIEVFKGKVPVELRVQSEIFLPGNCTLPMLAGADYLLYLDGKDNRVWWPEGSTVLFNRESAEARQQIEALRTMRIP